MSYAMWIQKVDAIAALMTGGLMHDDFDYDWRDAWEWGDDPQHAVRAAVAGVHSS